MIKYAVIGALALIALVTAIVGSFWIRCINRAIEKPPRAPRASWPHCCLPEDSYEAHLEHSQEISYNGIIQMDDEFLVNASEPAAAEWGKIERILVDSHGDQERMFLYSNREGRRYWIVESEFRKIAAPYRPHK